MKKYTGLQLEYINDKVDISGYVKGLITIIDDLQELIDKKAIRIHQYILDFGSITTREAVMDLGILRLASRIFEMRQDMRIGDKMESGTNRYGDKVSYKRYYFEEESQCKFSINDTVVCVNIGLIGSLTNGKPYKVINVAIGDNGWYIQIKDDDNKYSIHHEDKFERR